MSGPGSTLREIHRLKRLAKDLHTKIEQGPRQQTAQKNKVARHEEMLKKAQDDLKLAKVHMHEREVELKTTDEKVKKYEKQLSDIMSKKEYEALKHEISHARGQIGKIEDQVLADLGLIEELAAKVPQAEQALKQVREEAANLAKDFESRMAEFARERDTVQQQLKEAEAQLPGDIGEQYRRIVAARGEDAFAAVENNNCAACYTSITAQNSNDLRRGMFFVCKSCGRMLYLAEDA
jgi:predicted  nucleic acid-binding Zn-ribbon protein